MEGQGGLFKVERMVVEETDRGNNGRYEHVKNEYTEMDEDIHSGVRQS